MAETLSEKVVVVTGASSGIGKALALELANEGAYLSLASRNAQRLDALVQECQQHGGRAIAVPTDVADESQCRSLIQRTHDTYGRIDMVVNNAGIDVVSKLEDLPDLHLFNQVMNVNFNGALYCTYYVLPYLKETGGRIVNIASLAGVMAVPNNTSYVASKFAMVGFSDSLRIELRQSGVSVTVIYPYWVVSEFHENYMDKNGVPKGPSGRAIYSKRTMTADQCARIVLKAARERKRQVLMQPGPIALWLKLIAPNIVDKIIMNTFPRPKTKKISES